MIVSLIEYPGIPFDQTVLSFQSPSATVNKAFPIFSEVEKTRSIVKANLIKIFSKREC